MMPRSEARTRPAARSPRRDIRFVSLAAVPWRFALAGRTRALTEAWAASGVPAAFVQVPSLRTGIERLIAGACRRGPGVAVLRPWPVCPSRWWARMRPAHLLRLTRNRARELRRRLDACGAWDGAVAIVVSPVWAEWLAALPFRRVIYDCIDDPSVHVPCPRLAGLFAAWEQALIARADGAVVTAETLASSIRARRPDLPIAVIRNGVDPDFFRAHAARSPRPADMPPPSRRIVGFVGALYEWIDWDLIEYAARALPELEFVFVGPDDGRGQARRFASARNVRFLGRRAHDRVPAYVQAFDVCWVPFRGDRVGLAANPVKIYEYLALGKPVVSTPVADVDSFGAHIRVGLTPAEVVEHIRVALEETQAPAEARRSFARAGSWRARAQAYAEFAAALG
ncbi:MAG TPA: hypothetical protein DCM87_10290 [Planctomycetes bacterium]|nr:hypothetical protein [Planctomycetota bacterium]